MCTLNGSLETVSVLHVKIFPILMVNMLFVVHVGHQPHQCGSSR